MAIYKRARYKTTKHEIKNLIGSEKYIFQIGLVDINNSNSKI